MELLLSFVKHILLYKLMRGRCTASRQQSPMDFVMLSNWH